jgi:hypothetical protein
MEYLTLYEKFPAGAENTQTWKNYYLSLPYSGMIVQRHLAPFPVK